MMDILKLKGTLRHSLIRIKGYKNILCLSALSLMAMPLGVRAMEGDVLLSAKECSQYCSEEFCLNDEAYTCLNLCSAHKDKDPNIGHCVATQQAMMESKNLNTQGEGDDDADLAIALAASQKEYEQEQRDLARAVEESNRAEKERQAKVEKKLERDRRMQEELLALEAQRLKEKKKAPKVNEIEKAENELERINRQAEEDKRWQEELRIFRDQQSGTIPQPRPLPPLPEKKPAPVKTPEIPVEVNKGVEAEKEKPVTGIFPPSPPPVPPVLITPTTEGANVAAKPLFGIRPPIDDDEDDALDDEFFAPVVDNTEKDLKKEVDDALQSLQEKEEFYKVNIQPTASKLHRNPELTNLRNQYQAAGQSIIGLRNFYDGQLKEIDGYHRRASNEEVPDRDYLARLEAQQQGFRNQMASLNKQIEKLRKDAEAFGIKDLRFR